MPDPVAEKIPGQHISRQAGCDNQSFKAFCTTYTAGGIFAANSLRFQIYFFAHQFKELLTGRVLNMVATRLGPAHYGKAIVSFGQRIVRMTGPVF